MIKHAALISTKTTITGIDENCIQPNAVDLRVKEIYKLEDSLFTISEDNRLHRRRTEIKSDDGWFRVGKGIYDIVTQHECEISDNECGMIVLRSSMTRNGCIVAGGVYDSGFKGTIGLCIHVSGPMNIKIGTRVAQFLIYDADTYKSYDGGYGLDSVGRTKSEESKLGLVNNI